VKSGITPAQAAPVDLALLSNFAFRPSLFHITDQGGAASGGGPGSGSSRRSAFRPRFRAFPSVRFLVPVSIMACMLQSDLHGQAGMETQPMKRVMVAGLALLACVCAAPVGATCWDQVEQLRTAIGRAGLSTAEAAELNRSLANADDARASDDSVRCEELVAEVQARLGMRRESAESPIPEADESSSRETPPSAAGAVADADTQEVPATYRNSTDLMNLSADDLVGRPVASGAGEPIAEIEAIVRDDATPRRGYAVLAYEDKEGVGDKRVIVSLDQLELRPDGSVRVPVSAAADLQGFVEYDSSVYEKYDGALADIDR
jgi:hypothetical protein